MLTLLAYSILNIQHTCIVIIIHYLGSHSVVTALFSAYECVSLKEPNENGRNSLLKGFPVFFYLLDRELLEFCVDRL